MEKKLKHVKIHAIINYFKTKKETTQKTSQFLTGKRVEQTHLLRRYTMPNEHKRDSTLRVIQEMHIKNTVKTERNNQ